MASLEMWSGFARQCGADMVAWINQTDALRKRNLSGVCNAITRDWAASCQGIRARGAFMNKFRLVDAQGRFFSHCVPEEYIQKQDELRTDAAWQLRVLKMVNAAANDSAKKFPNDLKLIEKANEECVRLETMFRGGPDCKEYFEFDTPQEVMDHVRSMDYESSVYILHMLKDGAGHAVGIEFVPGKDKTGEGPGQKGYPPFYQFIDPNTGLFLFDAFRGLQVFFTVPVVKFYAPKNYDTYKLYVY
jgi:hypothetical protein